MIITSKYPGKCYECGEEYDVGERIWWEGKGIVPVCLECHERDEANEKSPIKPVQKGVTARYNPPAKPIFDGELLSYEDIVKGIRGSSDTQIPALLVTCLEEAIRRSVFQEGGLERFVAKVKAKFQS